MSQVTILALASAARATYTSGQLLTTTQNGQIEVLAADINVTALTGGASPTVTFKLSRVGADTVLYQVWQPTALSAAGVFSTTIGPGCVVNADLGDLFQVDMITTGAPTSVTFSASIKAKAW
jgi:hypothetical protein